MFTCQPPVPQNVAIFGNRAVEEVIMIDDVMGEGHDLIALFDNGTSKEVTELK